jgi:5-methylcytosine-specific restriction endonuclease McrA
MAYKDYRDGNWEEHLWDHASDSPYLDDPDEDVDHLLRTRAQEVEERQMAYDAFLRSDYWEQVKSAVHARAKGCCEGCGTHCDSLEVHHKQYPMRGTELENLHMLEALCRKCHHASHS